MRSNYGRTAGTEAQNNYRQRSQRSLRQSASERGKRIHYLLWLGLFAALTACAQETHAPAASSRWGNGYLRRHQEWYASAEARKIADNILQYQSPQGAWPKNTDLTQPPSPEIIAQIEKGAMANTIDNGATTTPMRFLALMAQATGEAKSRAAVERGIDYLLEAQYANGGWPQFFPLRNRGYYSHITFNDDAMINVLLVLRDAAVGKQPFDFVDAGRRARATAAVGKGIECILRTQVREGGKLTAWCAQHDEKTLDPVWARNFEPPALSGAETAGIVRFLMEVEQPAPEVIAAVEGAMGWLKTVAIHGLRIDEFMDADGKRDRRVVADPDAMPLWARFYERGTHRPIFTGRDKVMRHALGEVEQERRAGYAYYGDWPAALLAKDYPRWRAKHKLP